MVIGNREVFRDRSLFVKGCRAVKGPRRRRLTIRGVVLLTAPRGPAESKWLPSIYNMREFAPPLYIEMGIITSGRGSSGGFTS